VALSKTIQEVSVTILQNKEEKLEKLRKDKQEKEKEEETFHPKTNRKVNEMYAYMAERLTSGDHNIDLYERAKHYFDVRKEKKSEDYWFEKDAKECKFKPEINKEIYFEKT